MVGKMAAILKASTDKNESIWTVGMWAPVVRKQSKIWRQVSAMKI
jgi:hypothetical protein